MEKVLQLHEFTTFRIGGAPRLYFHPASESGLRDALAICREQGVPWRILGGGSNLLVEDGPLPFAVIRICSPGLDGIRRTGSANLRVGAGLHTARLLSYCRDRGLGGLEFLAALPGTVGGAVAGNAGAWGQCISERLESIATVVPDGGIRVLPRESLPFSYRFCPLKGRVITEVEFRLEPRDPDLIALQIRNYAAQRAERHPLGQPSAGCIFKNPAEGSAGRMLDSCGFRGLSRGGAQVSPVHANFIVNVGNATAANVLGLIEEMKGEVRRRFGVDLELEVRHWHSGPQVA